MYINKHVQFSADLDLSSVLLFVDGTLHAQLPRLQGIMPRAGDADKRPQTDEDICQIVCKKEACAIQWCLARWNYDQKKCQPVVQRWDACCDAARERARLASGKSSSKEPLPDLDRAVT